MLLSSGSCPKLSSQRGSMHAQVSPTILRLSLPYSGCPSVVRSVNYMALPCPFLIPDYHEDAFTLRMFSVSMIDIFLTVSLCSIASSLSVF